MKFVDEISFPVASGKGGDGAVSFRREKFVPRGGPDGGHGGRGGSLIFEATTRRNTLVDFHFNKTYRAEDGEPGGKRNRTGRSGDDRVLWVPVGTMIYDDESDELLADLAEEGSRYVIEGGRGGAGNAAFKTSTRRTPRFAKDGQPGTRLKVRLELKLLADVGLLGLPNAGKSTLISRISAARPKVGAHPFTTLVPNLGVVSVAEGASFVVADIPGLIDGAAEGRGLGHQFLRHIERCGLLLHLVAPDDPQLDPVQAYRTLRKELQAYDAALSKRPELVALSKTDLLSAEEQQRWQQALSEASGSEALAFSAVSGEQLRTLVGQLHQRLQRVAEEARSAEEASSADDAESALVADPFAW